VGTTYTTHPRVAYIIKKLGTNDTSAAKLVVDNKVLGSIIQNVAPERKTNSTIVGPLELGDLFYVIPPDTDFYVEGTSGKGIRVIGDIMQLLPGESLPGSLLDRYRSQPDHHLTYVTGSHSFGSATAWSAGDEVELYSLTPKTIEEYLFDMFLFIEYSGFTANPGDVAIQFYLDNNPIEGLFSENLAGGVDLLAIPAYNGASANDEPFSLKDHPIKVLGDHTLKVTAKNVSGGDISLSSASITFYALAKYKRTA